MTEYIINTLVFLFHRQRMMNCFCMYSAEHDIILWYLVIPLLIFNPFLATNELSLSCKVCLPVFRNMNSFLKFL